MMVEMAVARLMYDSGSKAFVVILQERGGERQLQIWIAQPEAESIVLQMKHVKRERPMTHDLCKSIIVGLGAQLRRVQITKVEKNTYFAELHLQREERMVQVDARPSDSIAIALRFEAPIFAQESLLTALLLEEGQTPPETLAEPSDEMSAEQLKEYLENLRPEDFGKFNM